MEKNPEHGDAPPVRPALRTRERVLEVLQQHPDGLTAAGLAAALGLKHNGVRKHLAALTRAGRVSAARRLPSAVGRPATVYRASSEAVPGYPHRMLSRMLLRAVEGIDAREAERIAFESGPSQALGDMLGSLGFAPVEVGSLAEARAGVRTIELRACPFLDLVDAPHGRLICAFHRGLVRRDMPEGAELDEFRILPDGPRCRIVLRGAPEPVLGIPA
jgi:DNA-binding transcriptional ArsR family regulator